LGIGLAERDVFRIDNLLKADYNIARLYIWAHWELLVLLSPIIGAFVVAQVLIFVVS